MLSFIKTFQCTKYLTHKATRLPLPFPPFHLRPWLLPQSSGSSPTIPPASAAPK